GAAPRCPAVHQQVAGRGCGRALRWRGVHHTAARYRRGGGRAGGGAPAAGAGGGALDGGRQSAQPDGDLLPVAGAGFGERYQRNPAPRRCGPVTRQAVGAQSGGGGLIGYNRRRRTADCWPCAISFISTWTVSTPPERCGMTRDCATGRWRWVVIPASEGCSPPAITRPAPTACARPWPRPTARSSVLIC